MAVIATLNTVFMAETSELDAAYKSMAKLQADANRLTSEARGPLGDYMQQVDRLGAIYDEGGLSLQDYTNLMAKAKEAYQSTLPPTAEMIAEQERLERQMAETSQRIQEAEDAARQWESVMDRGKQVTQENLTPLERYEKELADLDRLLDQNAISFDTWTRAQSKAFRSLTKNIPHVQTLGEKLRSLGSELKNSIAGNIAAAFGIREMAQFVAQGFAAVDALNDVSQATGVSTQQLGALHVAAQLNASSTEDIDAALRKLNKSLGSAEGSSKIAGSLDQLGLSAERLRSMGVGQAFVEISEAMRKIEDPAERARIAADLFGKSGDGMLNVLALGRDGFNAAAAEAQAYGLAISDVDAGRVGEAADAIDRVKLSSQGLAQELAVEFAPVIEFFADAIPKALKYAQIGFLNFAEGVVWGIGGILKAASMLPDWLGGGIASDASQFTQILLEELQRKEDEIYKRIDAINNKGRGSQEKMFEAPAAAISDMNNNAAAGLDQLVTDAKNFFAFATTVGANAQREAAKQGVANLMEAGGRFADFLKAAKANGDKMIQEKASSVIDSVMTPMEKFEKTIADLEALKNVGAIDGNVFARAQAKALSELDSATSQGASQTKNAALERGTAAAFAAERSGKDSPLKTQKDILEQAKRQTAIQEEQLAAFKEGGAVPVNF